MNETATTHVEEHQNQIRGLVEDSLSADERRLAEQQLLSCAACLEEYHWYSRVWASLTNSERFQRWGRQLAARDPLHHETYRRVVELASETDAINVTRAAIRIGDTDGADTSRPPSARAGLWGTPLVWRNLWFASTAAFVLVVSTILYQSTKNATTSGEQLRAKVVEITDLKARLDRLSSETGSQGKQLAELRQALERYAAPRLNTLLSIDLSPTRQPGDTNVKSLKLPPDKTFLELRIAAVEKKNYENYSMILQDVQGHPVWQSDAVAKNEDDIFSLTLGTSFLKPGIYQLFIYGQHRLKHDLIAYARFRLIREPT